MIKGLLAESLKMIKGQKIYVTMIILIFIISTVSLFITADVISDMNAVMEDFHVKYTESNCYGLSDSLQDGEMGESETTRLMKLYGLLSNSTDFNYMQMYDNPSGIFDFKGDKSFDYYADEPDYYTELPNNYLCVNSMMIGKEVIDRYQLKVCSGHFFSDIDYKGSLKEEKELPVILGYEYKGYYDIGDTINCDIPFFYKCNKMKIIGFLEKSSSIKYLYYGNSRIVNLDNYILVPSYDFDSIAVGDNADLYLNMIYYMKCVGLIETDLSKEYVQSIINDYSQQCGLPTYYIQSANNIFIDNIGMDLQELSSAFIIVSLFIIGFISIVLACFLVVNYRLNEKSFAIMLCNGYGYIRLFFMNLFIISFICSAALILSIFVFYLTLHNIDIELSIRGLLLAVLFYLFEISLSGVITYIQLRKINIGLLLRSR